jgi:hypothetical protein
METFGSSVPDTANFNIGYFEGAYVAKTTLILCIYTVLKPGIKITLWCDAKKTTPKEEQQV